MASGARHKGVIDEESHESILERFAATVAHEIRNPLSNIQLNASLLERELEGQPHAREIAERITNNIRKVDHLISRILNYASRPKTRMSSIDLCQVLEDSLSFVSFWISESHVDLRLELPDGPVLALGDAEQLQQVFLNLLLNSIEAINQREGEGPAGRLTITLRSLARSVRVVVEDNGVGMDGMTLQQVFDPFFSTKRNGTGLGLSVVQTIIENHGGEITCMSRPGVGTRFEVQLQKNKPKRTVHRRSSMQIEGNA